MFHALLIQRFLGNEQHLDLGPLLGILPLALLADSPKGMYLHHSTFAPSTNSDGRSLLWMDAFLNPYLQAKLSSTTLPLVFNIIMFMFPC